MLGLVVGTEARSRTPEGKEVVTFPLRDRVLEAGSPNVLLSAIETHKGERELCISCYSVLAMSRSPAVAAAVTEMQAVDTAVTILRANANDSEYVGVLLELLWGWASEPELASTIAARAGGIIVGLISSYCRPPPSGAGGGSGGHDDRLQHLNYLLNLMIALVRQRVAAPVLLGSGIVGGLGDVVELVVGPGNGSAMLAQRALVLQVATILGEIVRPPTGSKEIPPTPSPPAAQAVVASGGGPVLERVLAAYKAVPDPKAPGQLLYDATMCERVYATLQDLVAVGYSPTTPLSLEPAEDAQALAPRKGSKARSGPPPPAAPAPPAAPQAPAPPPAAGAPLTGLPEHTSAPALLEALRARGCWFDVWIDGKPRRSRLSLTAHHIIILFEEALGSAPGGGNRAEPGAGREEYSVPLSALRVLVVGLPAGYKKKLIGRNARGSCSLSLEETNDGTRPLLHVEAASEAHRNALCTALAQVTGATVRQVQN